MPLRRESLARWRVGDGTGRKTTLRIGVFSDEELRQHQHAHLADPASLLKAGLSTPLAAFDGFVAGERTPPRTRNGNRRESTVLVQTPVGRTPLVRSFWGGVDSPSAAARGHPGPVRRTSARPARARKARPSAAGGAGGKRRTTVRCFNLLTRAERQRQAELAAALAAEQMMQLAEEAEAEASEAEAGGPATPGASPSPAPAVREPTPRTLTPPPPPAETPAGAAEASPPASALPVMQLARPFEAAAAGTRASPSASGSPTADRSDPLQLSPTIALSELRAQAERAAADSPPAPDAADDLPEPDLPEPDLPEPDLPVSSPAAFEDLEGKENRPARRVYARNPENANKVVQGRVDRTRKSLAGHGIEAATVDARGARRSTRQRFRPLEWWRNEKVEYGRPIGSLPTVTEVSVRSPDPMWPTYKKNSGTSRDR